VWNRGLLSGIGVLCVIQVLSSILCVAWFSVPVDLSLMIVELSGLNSFFSVEIFR